MRESERESERVRERERERERQREREREKKRERERLLILKKNRRQTLNCQSRPQLFSLPLLSSLLLIFVEKKTK
jgi:hypothetical protein